MGVAGPMYTYAQLEQIWIANGGSPVAAPIAAAIAMAESGGGANSTNNNSNGTQDRGLWQINTVHGAQSTFDPNANAAAAVAISSNGSNWSPWATFTSGAYKQYLQSGIAPSSAGSPAAGTTPVGAAAGLDPSVVIGNLTDGLSKGILDAVMSFLNPFLKIVWWGAEVLVGLGLMAYGGYQLVSHTESGKEIENKVVQGAEMAAVPEAAPEIAAEKKAAKVAKKVETRPVAAKPSAEPLPSGKASAVLDAHKKTGRPLPEPREREVKWLG